MSEKSKTRQSPYSLSAEKAVLGCLLLNKEAIYKTVHSLSINAFYDYDQQLLGSGPAGYTDPTADWMGLGPGVTSNTADAYFTEPSLKQINRIED